MAHPNRRALCRAPVTEYSLFQLPTFLTCSSACLTSTKRDSLVSISSSERGVPWTGLCLGFPVISLISARRAYAGRPPIRSHEAARELGHDKDVSSDASSGRGSQCYFLGRSGTRWVPLSGQSSRPAPAQAPDPHGRCHWRSLPLACQDWANTKAATASCPIPKFPTMRSFRAISKPPEPALPPSVALSWSFRTQPNCPTKEHSLNGLVRPAGSTAAGTRKVATGCTRSAGCSCTLAWL